MLKLEDIKKDAQIDGPHYIKHPFKTEPEFGVASANYDLQDLLARAIKLEASL